MAFNFPRGITRLIKKSGGIRCMPLQRHCAEICINLAGIPGLETPEILWMASFKRHLFEDINKSCGAEKKRSGGVKR